MATQLEFLLVAHFRGDEGAFRTAVLGIIENDSQVNRSVVAAELERILRDANARPRRNGTGTLHGVNGSNGPPKDRDKNAPLLEVVERREIEELVLSPTTRGLLDRAIGEWRKAEVLKAHGLRPAGKLLFHGPPGCGKTVAVEALARAHLLAAGHRSFRRPHLVVFGRDRMELATRVRPRTDTADGPAVRRMRCGR
jgi:hypothetical protein